MACQKKMRPQELNGDPENYLMTKDFCPRENNGRQRRLVEVTRHYIALGSGLVPDCQGWEE